MQFGTLRHRITVTRLVPVADGRGGYTQGTATVGSRLPALVEMWPEMFATTANSGIRAPVRITMRFYAGVLKGQTVIYHSFTGDRTLEIVSPPEVDETDRSMVLRCREVTS